MPVTPTYPGVYIEEVPSTVRTIVGVSTSVTAFVGYTARGPSDQPTQVFNFGDYERAFGDLDVDAPLGYAVQQFFLNGGSDAWIVRASKGAAAAAVDLEAPGGQVVLQLSARSAGVWANTLRITVDRDTLNPDSLFNVTVTEYVAVGGGLVPGSVETFRNLTLNSKAPTYAVDVVNFNSKLLSATRGAGVPAATSPGTSVSGSLPANGIVIGAGAKLAFSLRGAAPVVVGITAGTYTRAALATELQTQATAAGVQVTATPAAPSISVTDAKASPDETSSVEITGPLASQLKFGYANGGHEVHGIAAFHPASTGTTGAPLTAALGAAGPAGLTPATGTAKVRLTVTLPGVAGVVVTVDFVPADRSLGSIEELRALLRAAIQSAALANPSIGAELAGATVAYVDDRLVVTAGGHPGATISFANVGGGDTTTAKIGLTGTGSGAARIAAYSPALGAFDVQNGSVLGADGSPPGATELIGDYDDKTGLYALRNVDLFNLLVLPDVQGQSDAVLTAAMSFCEERRAFLITDLPTSRVSLAQGQDWIKDPATPKSANAAAYFPRPLIPDPLKGYRPGRMPGAGAIAGLYARTDASRGVWKAPAGTEAALRGPTGVDVAMTDMENGTINPLGLNALRALPVYGHVVWGARTLQGSDQAASQWKYVPVRRTALFIEETLYRGTKWVVFEPNDEPLWAQIRLSIGAFMHGLFRQGAFQGASPRQAYLVKCDRETTTQADIDRGIVNIVVGFAPLKPAEFVVIKLAQLAGQLDA